MFALETGALRSLQLRIGQANADKGFHEEGDSLRSRLHGLDVPGYLRNYAVSRLALITTEVAEAIEEIRHGRGYDETYYVPKDEAEASNLRDGLTGAEAGMKPEGVPSELADIVIRALDFADEFDIDLAAIIDEKLAYNATRPFKHGKEM
jgi:NTP pyrophosphatase (non-canonical NTP hydrolase)